LGVPSPLACSFRATLEGAASPQLARPAFGRGARARTQASSQPAVQRSGVLLARDMARGRSRQGAVPLASSVFHSSPFCGGTPRAPRRAALGGALGGRPTATASTRRGALPTRQRQCAPQTRSGAQPCAAARAGASGVSCWEMRAPAARGAAPGAASPKLGVPPCSRPRCGCKRGETASGGTRA
jgi:hypothetical protein